MTEVLPMVRMVIRPVPIVLAATAVITGAGVVAAGVYGGVRRLRAEAQTRELWAAYSDRYSKHLAEHERTNVQLQAFGRQHEQVHNDVVLRMRDVLMRNNMQVRVSELLILDGVEFSTSLQVMAQPKLDLDPEGWAKGLVLSAQAGHTVWSFLRHGMNQIATASTGAAASDLHGAAREAAREAFMGGGTLASGGGGRALGGVLGKAVVGGIVVGSAGATAYKQGEKAMTEAEKHRRAFDLAIESLNVVDRLFHGVREQAQEKDHTLAWLAARASKAIDALGDGPLDPAIHGDRFELAWSLVKAVQQVAVAPVADENSNLDADTGRLIFKYRKPA
ncbi:hypothetical protein ABT297_32715 [Dactylosporangium sp. NPDC000555]|uniref:hypothetical protein n=1 Tax=Dactylosporangium sp. NPDC000555 TaxID=3154260 RepID=UPI00332929CB